MCTDKQEFVDPLVFNNASESNIDRFVLDQAGVMQAIYMCLLLPSSENAEVLQRQCSSAKGAGQVVA